MRRPSHLCVRNRAITPVRFAEGNDIEDAEREEMMPRILQNHHVLAVPDVRVTAAFFVEALGFEVVNEPDGWIFVARDNCMFMLGECPDAIPPGQLGDHSYVAYLRVDDADAYLAEITARGFRPISPIASKPWGIREFNMRTPDGHRLNIGHIIPGGPQDR